MYENQFVIVKRLYGRMLVVQFSLYIRSTQNHTCSRFIFLQMNEKNNEIKHKKYPNKFLMLF